MLLRGAGICAVTVISLMILLVVALQVLRTASGQDQAPLQVQSGGVFSSPAYATPPAPPSELCLAQFVAEVQARNPSLQAMLLAWQAAAQRYPQVIALDDPMFTSRLAPASFGSNEVEGAYALELAQKFPWFGKRAARGRSARAEANTALQDAEEARLRLNEIAQLAFFDYYLVSRQQDLVRSNVEVMRQLRDSAEEKYRANQVGQQDLLSAEVELVELERRQLEFDRMSATTRARINTLLHQAPGTPLPPPPTRLAPPLQIEINSEQLQQVALQRRPDLASLAAQIDAARASLALANKAYLPDTELFGAYDTFWQPASTQGDLRGQVGVRLNVPIYYGRLSAGVREANYRIGRQQAEFEQKLLDVQYEVQEASAQFIESRHALRLYAGRLVPLAEQGLSAARSNYDVGKGSFLELASAQRSLIDMRQRHEEAAVAYQRRIAELERIIGGPLPSQQAIEEVPVPLPDVNGTR